MFRLLVEIFKREDLLQQAYETSIQMLKSDNIMFLAASKSMVKEGTASLDIYKMDQEINEYQREVRRKVVAHLATSTSRDIIFGLVLISIIIDIERIGDYTKNIMDLSKNHPDKLDFFHYDEKIKNIEKCVESRFTSIITAFTQSDENLALTIMKEHKGCNDSCDSILQSFITEDNPEIPSKEAIVIALYVRYLKRISAHITNVASGIVNTFDNIGFKESK